MDNYLLVPGNTDLNRGDQALIWESIRIIKEIDSEADFALLSTGETEEEKYLQSYQTKEMGYKFFNPLVNHPGRGEKEKNKQYYSKVQYIKWGVRAIKDLIPRVLILPNIKLLNKIGFKFLSEDFTETYSILKNSKAVIFKGGGFIHSYGAVTDSYVMFYFLYYAMLAKKFNIKVIFMPNSFGPFRNKLATILIKKVLQNVELITVREKISQSALSHVIQKRPPFYPDLGFFMPSDESFDAKGYLKKLKVPFDKIKVGITVRPYRFDGHPNPEEAYAKYIKSFTEFIEYLIAKHYHPVLIAQTMGPSYNEDDNEAIKLIVSKLKEKHISVISDGSLNAKKIKKIYSCMNYVVGTRFHSVIFSLSSNVPSIAISYGGNKGKGIMEEMGLSEFEIPIEDLSEHSLIETFKSMELNKDSYISQIERKMKEYLVAREELKKEIRRVLK
ncbi:hypothetical protein BAOM_4756 [Peribacillus asahii]|uniref:Polysaccharide pyruvyl transferase domain-containing protein n=1 Tax=Peribacillus asahii TaxID=228899 RepID=A0A3Q9RMS1_9BACI|nr:polysaccharide pyruvyl transferase family protein [Peribacillus asahii]AZV45334.1 hypothetical protein BAOM_4756 [Peribacillus asahii]